MAKEVSPGVKALRKVVDDVHADARRAHAEGKLVGWSSSKFPCELAAAFDLDVMYPENQAAGIAANRDGEIMCQAAEDLGAELRFLTLEAEEGADQVELLRRQADMGVDAIVEIGPGKALSGFVKKTVPGIPVCAVETAADVENLPDTLEQLIKEKA